MEYEKLQANRKKALEILESLKNDAYSELTCEEFEIIKSAYHYIKMRKKLDELENTING